MAKYSTLAIDELLRVRLVQEAEERGIPMVLIVDEAITRYFALRRVFEEPSRATPVRGEVKERAKEVVAR
jgi:hypothetical protein